ncbi:MAG: YdeI/OmpD-associated family protein, partial [Pseudomonadota bacterium]
MTGYVHFEARIEPMEWGRSVYTVLPLPSEIMRALGDPKRVEGEIADYPVNLAPSRAPAEVFEGAFLWTGKSLLREAGVVPGELVDVRLRPADPNAVELPGDVSAALREADATAVWEALTPGRRRSLLQSVVTAKRP